ncbi:zinc finger protein [Trichuris trichiura]|uniref:Zinc finger protein n=1 Tax=Trichuris trichiura TaxID=36087 RepID=A0A077Z4T4_TRITR|nr:zinc finger protein [Trichuris trichiura]
MPYRTELRRPDLKGTFRCSLCNKIFCHSSSLSRHRMQAHFKSYTCTLCNKEITSNETLRAHMYKKHQISRMFMCRCCNWAFPDKTSLHIHMQAMATGNPGNVSIIAKSCPSPPPCSTPIGVVNSNGNSSHGGIFPAMPTREVINRLRERALVKGLTNAPSGLDLSSLFPAFSKFLAPGLGAAVADDSSSIGSIDKGTHGQFADFTGSPDGSESFADECMEIKCDADESNDMEEAYNAEEENKSCSESPLRPSSAHSHTQDQSLANASRSSDAEQHGETLPLEMLMSQSAIGSLCMDTAAGQADLPILRSAISASPLNSLLYQKKLNNVLRNKANRQSTANSVLSSGITSLMYANKPFTQRLFAAAAAAGYHSGNGFLPNVNPFLGSLSSEKGLSPDSTVMGTTGDPQHWSLDNVQRAVSPAESTGSRNSSSEVPQMNGRCSSSSIGKSPVPVAVSGGTFIAHGTKEPAAGSSCFDCQLMKGRVAQAENRCRFLESKTTSQESKISRLETRIGTLEANNRRYESETHLLRDHCDKLERRILECQERALRYLQGQSFKSETTEEILLEILESCRVYK